MTGEESRDPPRRLFDKESDYKLVGEIRGRGRDVGIDGEREGVRGRWGEGEKRRKEKGGAWGRQGGEEGQEEDYTREMMQKGFGVAEGIWNPRGGRDNRRWKKMGEGEGKGRERWRMGKTGWGRGGRGIHNRNDAEEGVSGSLKG